MATRGRVSRAQQIIFTIDALIEAIARSKVEERFTEASSAIEYLQKARDLVPKCIPLQLLEDMGLPPYGHWWVHKENVPGEGATEANIKGEVFATAMQLAMERAVQEGIASIGSTHLIRPCKGCLLCKVARNG